MEQKGSFIGFTFGSRHSSELGIFRTSSDGYNSHWAQITDVVTSLETMDGQYYWGTNYSKRDIPISFAFYGLTEEQLNQIKQLFNDKKIHSLILDEEPYKVWSAKLTGTMVAKHLCFDDGVNRFYCGEGELVFTIFYPFARSRYQYAEDYTKEKIREWIDSSDFSDKENEEIICPAILTYDFDESELSGGTGFIITFKEWLNTTDFMTSNLSLDGVNSSLEVMYDYNLYGNRDQWIQASKIPKKEDGYGEYSSGKYKLYNAGDLEIPFKIYFSINGTPQNFCVQCGDKRVLLQNVVSKNGDSYIVLDSHTLTVQGCDENYNKTKNLYNEKINEGGLFKLPVGEIELLTTIEADFLDFNYLYL